MNKSLGSYETPWEQQPLANFLREKLQMESTLGYRLQGVQNQQETSAQTKQDMVNHPPHYTRGGIECIDAIKAALTEQEFRGYLKGTAMAYIWRERYKNGDEDVAKAGWYINRICGVDKGVDK